jgi:hypothetical protein
MINDMDNQQKCVIMSMEDIEQMFREMDKRIGLHERDVVVLEDRVRAFGVWWNQSQVEAPGIVIEETQTQQRIYGAMDTKSIKGIRQQGEDG